MAVNVDWVQAGGYSAIQDRQVLAALLSKSAINTVRAGILQSTGSDLAVTANGTPNMTVNVAAGALTFPDSAGAAYVGTNTATKSVTIAASDPTNPRLDLIIFRVYDNEAGDVAPTSNQTQPGSTAGTAPVQTKTGDIEVVPGTPGAVPVEPSLPTTRCVVLKRVRVRAATASILTSDIETATAQIGFTTAAGGILSCTGPADYPPNPYPGQVIDDLNLGVIRYNTAAVSWKLVGGADTGWITATLTNSWVTFGAPTQVPRYRKMNGIVYVEGSIKLGVMASPVFTLPVGFRPNATLWFAGGAGAASPRIDVNADGTVLSSFTNGGCGINFCFPADQ